MSLQMILGNAGSGKSSYLYDLIIQQAKEHPEQTYLVLVPEQFTMSTQREFVARTDNHCIMNIDVLSFERLAYRVFDELGITDLTVLEDIGKTLIIRKIARQKRDELRVLKRNIERPGFLDQVKSLLTEFNQYHVTVDELRDMLSTMQESLFYHKLKDITLLYQGLEEYMKDKYITAEKLLLMLSKVAHKSAMLQNAVIAFDGYTGFTPVQNILLQTILPMVRQMYVTILIDVKQEYMQNQGVQELFYLSKKFIHSLIRLANETGISLDEPVIMKEPCKARFQNAAGLAALEQNLFRINSQPYKAAQEDIQVVVHKNPQKEMEYVASQIHERIKQGMRYQDVAVVTADMDTYGQVIREIFTKAHIPYYIDEKKTIGYNSFVELIRGLLTILTKDFTYEGVFSYLKTGLTNLTDQEIHKLENYCLAERIRGLRQYEAPFHRLPDGYTQQDLDDLNEIRQKFMEPLIDLAACFSENNMQDVATITTYLYQCITNLSVEKKLLHLAEEMETVKEVQLAKQYRQIYAEVMKLLDKYVSLMGEEVIDLTEYQDILMAGLMAIKIGQIPAGRDCVILGDIERTRLEHIHTLFFVGVNEGVIPRIATGSMCLTQSERDEFARRKIELAAGPKERMFIQRFYLYMTMTKADRELIVTYAKQDMTGNGMKPSYLIDTLTELFPCLVIADGEDASFLDVGFTPEMAIQSCVGQMQARTLGAWQQEAIAYLSQHTSYQDRMKLIVSGLESRKSNEQLEQELVEDLYQKDIVTSVTRLESLAKCNMQHFINYGLKLCERNLGAFTAMDMGSIFHRALELYSNNMKQAGYSFATTPAEWMEQQGAQAVRDAISDLNQTYLYENARTKYQIEGLIRIMKRTLWALAKQMQESQFEPKHFEQKFRFQPNGTEIQLQGKIDRIDIRQDEEGMKYQIVDYKSGNTKLDIAQVYDGTQLQLLTYLNAAKSFMEKNYPNRTLLADGVYYYHMKDPLIKVDASQEEQVIEQKRLKELQLEGVNDPNEIKLLADYTNNKIIALGEEIQSGLIQTNPIMQKDVTSCDYCNYRGICGFDDRDEDCKYRQGTIANKEAILEKMRQEKE